MHLLGRRGGEGLVQFALNLGCLGQAQSRRRNILAYSTQFLIRIRLLPINVVMVATDMYRKSPYGSRYTELRESMTFLPFLFNFRIINFYNFSYIFTLHHCSAIRWDFILRLIRLDMCIIFLFVSVIILFVYDSDRYGTAATFGKELFMITIY